MNIVPYSRYKKLITLKEAQSYAARLGITLGIDTIRAICKKKKFSIQYTKKGKIFIRSLTWERYLETGDYNEKTQKKPIYIDTENS